MLRSSIFIALIFFFTSPLAFATDYRPFLDTNEVLVYKHWSKKKNKITGYSRSNYKRVESGGKTYLVEYQENTKPSGKKFTQKELWFDANNGEVVRYWETDLRKDLEIRNRFERKKIKTTITDKGKIDKMEQRRERGLVPIELLPFYLRREVEKHAYKKSKKFKLYIPAAPGTTWEFEAKRKKKVTVDTPFGKLKAVQLLLKPTSFMASMLPKEKTNFRFTVATEKPYHVLKIEEGETILSLESVK